MNRIQVFDTLPKASINAMLKMHDQFPNVKIVSINRVPPDALSGRYKEEMFDVVIEYDKKDTPETA